jgi:hypothetical protein
MNVYYKSLFYFILFLILGCSSTRTTQNLTFKQELVKSILCSKHVNSVLYLDSAKNILPAIRITDLTREFKGCDSYYKCEKSKIIIPYYVVSKLSVNINTGYYRDFVIINCKNEKEITYLTLFAAPFGSKSGEKINYLITLVFHFDKEVGFTLIDEKAIEYDEGIKL